MVVRLEVAIDPEGRPAGVNVQFRKDRAAKVDARRSLIYNLSDGQLLLSPEVEIVSSCDDAVITILYDAHRNGVEAITTKSLMDEAFTRFKKARKTVENTLGRITGTGKGNNPKPVIRKGRGKYALAPHEIQRLDQLSCNRAPYEMGGVISKSIGMTGISKPPIETPEGETGGNANPQGETVGGIENSVTAPLLSLSPPVTERVPLQASQPVSYLRGEPDPFWDDP